MDIKNMKITGLETLDVSKSMDAGLLHHKLNVMSDNIKLSFFAEGINRFHSTIICEVGGSYVQQSQRYVEMSPENLYYQTFEDIKQQQLNELLSDTFELYNEMTTLKEKGKGRPVISDFLYGIPYEDARYILPLAVTTNIQVTLSLKQLKSLVSTAELYFSGAFEEVLTKLLNNLPDFIVTYINNSSKLDYAKNEVYYDLFKREADVLYIEDMSNCSMESVAHGALTSTTKNPFIKERTAQELREVTDRVLSYGHTSILEQAYSSFELRMSMATYHQFVRHRIPANIRESIFAVAQYSTEFIIPESIKNSEFLERYIDIIERYRDFRKPHNGTSQTSMFFITNADKVSVISTVNARGDVEIAKERTCLNAQWEIRTLYTEKIKQLLALAPELYQGGVPSCVHGKCKEGKLSCGKAQEVKQFWLNA